MSVERNDLRRLKDADLDGLLRRSLSALAEPTPAIDLAARAINLAKAQQSAETKLRLLRSIRRWTALSAVAACIAMAVLAGLVVKNHLSAGGFTAWSSDTTIDPSSTSTTISSTDTTSSFNSTEYALLAGGLVLAVTGLAGVTLLSTPSDARRSWQPGLLA